MFFFVKNANEKSATPKMLKNGDTCFKSKHPSFKCRLQLYVHTVHINSGRAFKESVLKPICIWNQLEAPSGTMLLIVQGDLFISEHFKLS